MHFLSLSLSERHSNPDFLLLAAASESVQKGSLANHLQCFVAMFRDLTQDRGFDVLRNGSILDNHFVACALRVSDTADGSVALALFHLDVGGADKRAPGIGGLTTHSGVVIQSLEAPVRFEIPNEILTEVRVLIDSKIRLSVSEYARWSIKRSHGPGQSDLAATLNVDASRQVRLNCGEWCSSLALVLEVLAQVPWVFVEHPRRQLVEIPAKDPDGGGILLAIVLPLKVVPEGARKLSQFGEAAVAQVIGVGLVHQVDDFGNLLERKVLILREGDKLLPSIHGTITDHAIGEVESREKLPVGASLVLKAARVDLDDVFRSFRADEFSLGCDCRDDVV